MHVIHQICLDYRETKDFSGAVLIRQGETTLYEGAFGLAHRGFNIANRPDTRFDTASVTKLFTAAAILRLVQEQRLQLEDRIADLIDLTGTRIPVEVTVFQLLTHTSGIADDADEAAGESYSALFADRPNYAVRQTRDFLPQFAQKEPLFPPATQLRYNNCAFVLLGLAIEAVTGKTYREYVAEAIFAPLGMDHSGFFAMDEPTPNVAEGYVAHRDEFGAVTAWRKNIYSYPPIGSPDGGALCTAGDLDLFIRGLRRGLVLDETRLKTLFSPQVPFSWMSSTNPGRRIQQGFVFEFIEEGGRIRCIRKDGINEGVGAMLAWYPDQDLTVVILANQDCDIWSLHRSLESVLLRDPLVQETP